MTAAYRAVAGRIRQDLDDVRQVANRAEAAWERYDATGDDHYLDSVALNLHDVYVGCERLFEDIARRVDGSAPDGPHWHQELLDQMSSDIPSTRPPVLSPETRRRLERYQGFRHVVRNVYAAEFDADQIAPLIRRLPAVCEAVTTELAAFADTLEEIAADGP
jgi:hypothetical protein